jgi:phosphoribosyl-ATP pyrophosphohydrolase
MELDVESYLASLDTIAARAQPVLAGETPTTYTQKLLADQNKRVQKLGTEAVELVREDCRPDFDEERFTGEAADTVYAVEVICAARGVAFVNVLNELARRNQAS